MCVFPDFLVLFLSDREERYFILASESEKMKRNPPIYNYLAINHQTRINFHPLASRAPKMNLRETFFRPFFLAPAKGESENMCTHIRPNIRIGW